MQMPFCSNGIDAQKKERIFPLAIMEFFGTQISKQNWNIYTWSVHQSPNLIYEIRRKDSPEPVSHSTLSKEGTSADSLPSHSRAGRAPYPFPASEDLGRRTKKGHGTTYSRKDWEATLLELLEDSD